jgi:uncharacterized protein
MAEQSYFFDTYALVELFKGNEKYRPFADCKALCCYLNLYELFYNLLKEYGEEKANPFFNRVKGFCVELEYGWIKEACRFRQEHKRRDLSYADCLGYVIARNRKVMFLTGDKEFEDLPNVEFVKA